MSMLERNSEHTERNLSSEGREQKDIRPPKEIGEETPERKADAPKEIGNTSISTSMPPKEINENSVSHRSSFVDADGNKCNADDYGKTYSINNCLIPNNSYELNGYKYETDKTGRIASCEGQLRIKAEPGYRPIKGVSLSEIGKGYEHETDERGHIIGNRFEGAGTVGNLIPQDKQLNNVEFNKFEGMLAKEKSQGNDVYVKYELNYPQDSFRPDSLTANYSINGEEFWRKFDNNPQRGEAE